MKKEISNITEKEKKILNDFINEPYKIQYGTSTSSIYSPPDTIEDTTGQKDTIDIILIVVSSVIIIASFTYLFFV